MNMKGISKNPNFVPGDFLWSSHDALLLKKFYPLHIRYMLRAKIFLAPSLA